MYSINHFILRRILKYSSYILKPLEYFLVKKFSRKGNQYPVLIIIGAPRTGSTLLYQLITSYLKVTYLDNFVYIGREIPFLSYLMSRKLFGNRTHHSFTSTYGSTYDLHEPSEAGNLWRKWMPQGVNYIQEKDIEEDKLKLFSDFIRAVSNKSESVFVIKNLYFSQRLRYLKASGLNVKLIYLRRNPVYTAQSIYMARNQTLKDIDQWWSVGPKNYEVLKDLEVYQQIAGQVYYIEKQIESDLQLFDKQDVMYIRYEDLENNVYPILSRIKKFINADFISDRGSNDFPEIKVRNQQNLPEAQFKRIQNEVNRLYD